jgi:hypothetical protein
MKKIKLSNHFLILVLLLIISFIPLSFVYADGGYIPQDNILVYEPSQSAVIGWIGFKESLVLSTNLYTSSAANGWVIELIPFPSLPDTPRAVSLDIFLTAGEVMDSLTGDPRSGDVNLDDNINIVDALLVAQYYVNLKPTGFYKFTADVDGNQEISIVDALLLAQYYVGLNVGSWGGRLDDIDVVFQDQIGIHNITVLETGDAGQLMTLAEQVLSEVTTPGDIQWMDLESIAADYINRGMRYWVVDLIDMNNSEMSRDPLMYTFESDSLYFPLVISSLNNGETLIDLVTITMNELDREGIESAGFEGIPINTYFDIHTPDFLDQFPDFMDVFGPISASPLKIARHYYEGPLSELQRDIIAGIR